MPYPLSVVFSLRIRLARQTSTRTPSIYQRCHLYPVQGRQAREEGISES
jgi:hypothetical protein